MMEMVKGKTLIDITSISDDDFRHLQIVLSNMGFNWLFGERVVGFPVYYRNGEPVRTGHNALSIGENSCLYFSGFTKATFHKNFPSYSLIHYSEVLNAVKIPRQTNQ